MTGDSEQSLITTKQELFKYYHLKLGHFDIFKTQPVSGDVVLVVLRQALVTSLSVRYQSVSVFTSCQGGWTDLKSTGLAEYSTVCLFASLLDDLEHGCLRFTSQFIHFARLPTHHLSHYHIFFIFSK